MSESATPHLVAGDHVHVQVDQALDEIENGVEMVVMRSAEEGEHRMERAEDDEEDQCDGEQVLHYAGDTQLLPSSQISSDEPHATQTRAAPRRRSQRKTTNRNSSRSKRKRRCLGVRVTKKRVGALISILVALLFTALISSAITWTMTVHSDRCRISHEESTSVGDSADGRGIRSPFLF
mmetsp:Transcript_16623/g.49728  ORF Transcript_16623/g.49728 Transcript_16623/m.49728 type:complete len:179 (-) Transcript_16623:113-649(-)|eukprot:CAMPEP_0177652768 /NCGR_PEP_ID=MMETSP0447-20121125/13323_1 /TAXON_ID=0 /ORGANISM="Stygamoeba regulata, Strain BSH-02190019" /LENGTH=178 /DNA_ID=CAMNT_0019156069 /DNA_START=123 /DNA_END=659 /DNA_ORIENTATION=-